MGAYFGRMDDAMLQSVLSVEVYSGRLVLSDAQVTADELTRELPRLNITPSTLFPAYERNGWKRPATVGDGGYSTWQESISR